MAGTGGEHKGGARNDWFKHRTTYQRAWRNEMDNRLAEGKANVVEICLKLSNGEEST